ncbi:MAG TPA: 50S ribosomal protein L11 methyltransferase [Chloroflexota bacterium]|jgi:ribosomal protein L11 methyltransferase|nr:50S ribosomal protein L11 methyltransferase [Chloroflexota bacterium]
MNWLEIAVPASHEASEAAYAVMSRYAPGRVAIEEPVIQPADGDGAEIDFSQPVTLRAYVPIDGAEASTRQAMEEALYLLSRIDIEGVGEVSARELAEEDWANAWKEHYHTRKVGRRLVIKPSWLDYDEGPEEVVVELDPGMAFGTGLHPTTDTCLQLLEDLVHGGEEVLDLGAGSGILSLAAMGLGAKSVLALDIETIAVDTCRANCAHVPAISVGEGSLPLAEPRTFDLVLANIIARVLVELASELRAGLRPGARLLASGIIDEREDEVLAAFANAGLAIERRVQSGDWVTLVCTS